MNDSDHKNEPSHDPVRNFSSISVVIPVYRAGKTIRLLLIELQKTLAQMRVDFEVILVNDASPDDSWFHIEELCQEFHKVIGINLTKNVGQHGALLAGFKHASGEVIITMDDDLQHPPSEIAKLLMGLASGADVAYGVPAQEQHGTGRDIASVMTKFAFQHMLGMKNARDTSAFRAIRSVIVKPFQTYNTQIADVDAMLTWTSDRFIAITTQHNARLFGESNYTFQKLLQHAIEMIVCYTTVPLRFASLIGILFTCFGGLVLLYILINYLIYGSAVPGFAFLAVITCLFSGAQLLALGFLGEYFSRIHFRIMGRPGAVERTVIRHSHSDAISK